MKMIVWYQEMVMIFEIRNSQIFWYQKIDFLIPKIIFRYQELFFWYKKKMSENHGIFWYDKNWNCHGVCYNKQLNNDGWAN